MGLSEILIADLPREEVQLVKRLAEAGQFSTIRLCQLTEEEAALRLRGISSIENGIIFLSTSQKLLSLANEKGVAAIAYQSPGCPKFLHADMVVEGFEEVDAFFLRRVYERKHGIPWQIAETERCLIRELSLEDVPELLQLYAEPGITDYMKGLHPPGEELAFQRAYIEHQYQFYGYGMWLVFEKKSGTLIGRAGAELHEDPETGEALLELGYVIRPSFQRQGYGYEVCRAVIRYLEEECGAEELFCRIREGNTASIRLAKKLGFSLKEERKEEKIVLFSRKICPRDRS